MNNETVLTLPGPLCSTLVPYTPAYSGTVHAQTQQQTTNKQYNVGKPVSINQRYVPTCAYALHIRKDYEK